MITQKAKEENHKQCNLKNLLKGKTNQPFSLKKMLLPNSQLRCFDRPVALKE